MGNDEIRKGREFTKIGSGTHLRTLSGLLVDMWEAAHERPDTTIREASAKASLSSSGHTMPRVLGVFAFLCAPRTYGKTRDVGCSW